MNNSIRNANIQSSTKAMKLAFKDMKNSKTNYGFITIINKEPILYTEEEVKDLLKLCLKEFSTTSKIDIPCVDEWFEQNKKK